MFGVIGDIVQDVVVWAEEEVRPATDTKSQVSTTRGGSAANVAAFAGRRYPTRFIGCVGDDLGGQAVEQELVSHGVDVRLQRRNHTGMIVVLIDPRGERSMFPSRGASAMLEPVCTPWLEEVRLLHITGYSFQNDPTLTSVIDAARQVKDMGGQLSLDVSSTGMIDLFGKDAFIDLLVELEPDFISANRDECALLGLADRHGPGPLLDRIDGFLLARAGKDATRIMQRGSLLASVPVPPYEAVRDMTGAGDAFNAGFLSAILQDPRPEPDLVSAAEAGHALARRVLANPGATESHETF